MAASFFAEKLATSYPLEASLRRSLLSIFEPIQEQTLQIKSTCIQETIFQYNHVFYHLPFLSLCHVELLFFGGQKFRLSPAAQAILLAFLISALKCSSGVGYDEAMGGVRGIVADHDKNKTKNDWL